MGINEAKKQIVIDNYFKNTCDVNTSIKEAFTKGFEVGLTKVVFPKSQYEARLKADMVTILDKIRAEVLEYIDDLDIAAEICNIFDKYKAESEEIGT